MGRTRNLETNIDRIQMTLLFEINSNDFESVTRNSQSLMILALVSFALCSFFLIVEFRTLKDAVDTYLLHAYIEKKYNLKM